MTKPTTSTLGANINTTAQMGVRVRSSTEATTSGSRRSKAAAKITRVDDKNIVPAQPKNHMLIATMISSCTTDCW